MPPFPIVQIFECPPSTLPYSLFSFVGDDHVIKELKRCSACLRFGFMVVVIFSPSHFYAYLFLL